MVLDESIEHLVVGGGWAALTHYRRLALQDGVGGLGLLVPRLLEKHDLRVCRPGGEAALVYREAAFHPLAEDRVESPWERYFFASPGAADDGEAGLREGTSFVEQLLGNQMEGTPVQIGGRPSGGYEVVCRNGLVLNCRHLHWMAAPGEFVRCYSGDISPGLAEDTPGSLYVRYSFGGALTDMTETLFFPLSYTRACGHFIGGFRPLQGGRQEVEFVTFVDMDDTPEEEISKKIRTLDRRLAKAFANFKKISHQKSIRLSSHLPWPGGGGKARPPEGVHFT